MSTEPFLRWAGGKRWLARRLGPIVQGRIRRRYFEPFLGGGGVFFGVEPRNAFLSDVNADLVNAYRVVMETPALLLEGVRYFRVDQATYDQVKAWQPTDSVERAIRFVYLNRTCYGGLYRTNRQGEFNVPFGKGSRTPELLWENGVLMAAAATLLKVRPVLAVSDFEPVLGEAHLDDVVYCDPTYSTKSFKQFDRYTDKVFRWEDQERLAAACHAAYARGALVIVSNSFCQGVQSLYRDAYRIRLSRTKAIGNRASSERTGLEYLIILDPRHRRSQWADIGPIERNRVLGGR